MDRATVSEIQEDKSADAVVAAEDVTERAAERRKSDRVRGRGLNVGNPIRRISPKDRTCTGPKEDVRGGIIADVIHCEFGGAGGERTVTGSRDIASPFRRGIIDFTAEDCPFGAVRNGRGTAAIYLRAIDGEGVGVRSPEHAIAVEP